MPTRLVPCAKTVQDRQAFHNEVDILGLVRHNNIVRIRGMAEDVDDLWIM